MEELDVEAVRQPGELGDPVTLLEAQHELLRDVVGGLELIEPEGEGGRLLAVDVEQAGIRSHRRRARRVPG